MAEDDVTRTRRRLSPEERTDQIVSAALRLFAVKGYESTTTRDIAEAAGVAEGLLFRYFRSKHDILLAVMQSDEPVPQLREWAAQLTGLPVREALVLLYTNLVDHLLDQRELHRVVFSEAIRSDEARSCLHRNMEAGVEFVAGLLRERIDRGELRPFDTRAAAFVFWGSGFSFFMFAHDRPVEDARPLLRWFAAESVDIVLRGLLS